MSQAEIDWIRENPEIALRYVRERNAISEQLNLLNTQIKNVSKREKHWRSQHEAMLYQLEEARAVAIEASDLLDRCGLGVQGELLTVVQDFCRRRRAFAWLVEAIAAHRKGVKP